MRRLLMTGMLSACALSAFAQTEVVTPSEAQKLGCLVKPAEAPRYPEQNKLDRAQGSMRLLLKFSKPDSKPAVEVLFNSAREDMQDRVYDYVAGYRLPCLQPEDGEVSAVQDFSFQNNDLDPTPIPMNAKDRSPLCIVTPRRDLDYQLSLIGRPKAEHLVALITFRGGPEQPPEVTFAYSNASSRYEQAVRERVSEYRMPCRTVQDKPRTVEQRFSMYPATKRRHGFTQERFPLMNFLAMTRDPKRLKAHFDLNTMGCPFSVNFVLGGGGYPHEASVKGRRDPNTLGFLRWLAALEFDFKSEDAANDLWGSELQVDVPCGTIDLAGDPAGGG